jgi:hypothetical protein
LYPSIAADEGVDEGAADTEADFEADEPAEAEEPAEADEPAEPDEADLEALAEVDGATAPELLRILTAQLPPHLVEVSPTQL